MKKRAYLILIGLLVSVTMLFAQDVPSGLTNAFKKGSSQELLPFLGGKVELIIQNKSQNYSKQEAGEAIKTFFSDNKVSNFTVNHQGKRDESSFIVGTLTTAKGAFRINCFFKKNENQYLIHQIRIDKTNE